MNISRTIDLLNEASYRVQFALLPAEGILPACPAVLLSCDGYTLTTRGVSSADALSGAVKCVLSEIEGKRVAELERRGALHLALAAELETTGGTPR